MSAFVTVKQGTSEIAVEVTPEGVTRPLGHLEDTVQRIDRTLDELLGTSITAHCAVLAQVFEGLKKTAQAPSGATLEFGLQLTGEGSCYVVRSSVQAAYKVTLRWELASPGGRAAPNA